MNVVTKKMYLLSWGEAEKVAIKRGEFDGYNAVYGVREIDLPWGEKVYVHFHNPDYETCYIIYNNRRFFLPIYYLTFNN